MTTYFKETQNQLQMASPVKRLAAMVYDIMIIIAIWMIIGFVAVIINKGEAVTGPLFESILFLLTFAFFAFFWIKSGQTLGMMAWRLRVQTPEGAHISPPQALIRFFAAGLSWAALCLGFAWMFFHPRRLTWHDLLSNSCVVQLPKAKE